MASEGLSRGQAIVVVVGLLVLPVALGVGLGWYGLDPIMEERLGPVASLAHELLNSFPDSRLTVEIAAPPGQLPPASAVAILSDRMNATLSKSSIAFVEETYSPTSSGPWDVNGLFALEAQVRHAWPVPGAMALCYLFVDGTYAGGSSVLGLTYSASSIAVFPSALGTAVSPNEVASILATVLVHEFGHEMGLVGLVGAAPNEDPAHPGHSSDPNDVMYWQVETTGVLGGLLGSGGPPTQFDAADLSDLANVRSTPIPQEIVPWAVLAVLTVAAVSIAVLYARGARRRRRSPDAGP